MAWLALLPLAIWAYLAVVHGRFWTTAVRLPPAADGPVGSWPAVAVVIPARDEVEVLGDSLPTVLRQQYPGDLSVVLVDDNSSDGTAGLAASLGRYAVAAPLTVVAAPARPEGWAGKLWALDRGIASLPAEEIGGPEWLLFTDADIAHPPRSVRQLVAFARDGQRDLVSLMARLRVRTGWERLLIPSFVYFFALLYPFRWVNARRAPVAAAAGGCVLVRRSALDAAGGLAAIRGAVIDDVALGRLLKRSGARIWLGLADEVRSIRPYLGLGDLWDMVARSAYDQLRYSRILLVLVLLGLVVTFASPWVVLVAGLSAGPWPAADAGLVASVLMLVTYLPMVRYYGLKWWWALTLPWAAVLYGAMTASSAWRHQRGGNAWKGRALAPAQQPAVSAGPISPGPGGSS